jgi:hypothetical protein
LVVMEVMTLSGHLSNINEMHLLSDAHFQSSLLGGCNSKPTQM